MFDVDFEDVCLQKRAIIQRCSDMFQRVASFLLESLSSDGAWQGPWREPCVCLRARVSLQNSEAARGRGCLRESWR